MQNNRSEGERLRPDTVNASEFYQLLELLLRLDRTVVELSMKLYNVPQQQRFAMREQNRLLHDAVRERLPAALSQHALTSKRQALRSV